jgi:hypothetical protein
MHDDRAFADIQAGRCAAIQFQYRDNFVFRV